MTALLLKTDSALSDAGTPSHPALAALPANMVWAWERPEDLRWLPDDVGVAYVASTIMLRGEEALVHPRTAQLLVREATPLVPVLHVDASWRLPPALSEQQTSRIAQELLRVAQRGNRHVVQLDFEVRRSQRPFLAATISAIRSRLDPSIALSVTALASWCLDDTWMQGSAADEIVPMAFRMGQEEQALRRRLAQQQGFKPAYCRSAVGFATDEPILNLRNKRRYYFSPTAWTADKWQATPHPLQTNATLSQPQFLTASQ
ncbi:hypothetical protein [Undibacterium terreum]|uniref:hypothetical protein n=1 Tax=Undibacterium terreum TaxID=1224302 RepID=UPI00166A8CA2|nr:hypothetical protein [Undibacterium terreum]